MNLIELLFKLLARFIDMEPGKMSELKDKAAQWQNDPNKAPWLQKLIQYQNLWYVQVALCFVFIFSVRSISRWMTADSKPTEDDDNGEDDEEEEAMIEEFLQRRKANKTTNTF